MLKQQLIKFCLFCSVVLFLGSCTFQDTSKIETYNFRVNKYDWKWNPYADRYECIFDFPEMSDKIYEKGAIVGSVFVYENNAETQKSLPFSQTYSSITGPYTETISFDTAVGNPNSICFYIQTSDAQGTYLLTYDFKITLISNY